MKLQLQQCILKVGGGGVLPNNLYGWFRNSWYIMGYPYSKLFLERGYKVPSARIHQFSSAIFSKPQRLCLENTFVRWLISLTKKWLFINGLLKFNKFLKQCTNNWPFHKGIPFLMHFFKKLVRIWKTGVDDIPTQNILGHPFPTLPAPTQIVLCTNSRSVSIFYMHHTIPDRHKITTTQQGKRFTWVTTNPY